LRPISLSVVGDDGSTTGGEMTAAAPTLPARRRGWTHRPAAREASAKPIEIYAPDRHATDLLLEHAAPLFPADVVPGCVWIVRLQPPSNDGGWALEVLSLVQRWLESARLPFANVRYDDRSYLVRPSTDLAHFAAAAESTRELSSLVTN
jgi:hypothetical protein